MNEPREQWIESNSDKESKIKTIDEIITCLKEVTKIWCYDICDDCSSFEECRDVEQVI